MSISSRSSRENSALKSSEKSAFPIIDDFCARLILSNIIPSNIRLSAYRNLIIESLQWRLLRCAPANGDGSDYGLQPSMRSEGGGIGKSNSGRGAGFYGIKTVKVGDWSAARVRANPLINLSFFQEEPWGHSIPHPIPFCIPIRIPLHLLAVAFGGHGKGPVWTPGLRFPRRRYLTRLRGLGLRGARQPMLRPQITATRRDFGQA